MQGIGGSTNLSALLIKPISPRNIEQISYRTVRVCQNLKKLALGYIYLEYFSVSPLVRIRTPPPLPPSECVPPPPRTNGGGGVHSPAGERVGGVPVLSTLWLWVNEIEQISSVNSYSFFHNMK
jgi:hypothetical protein